MIDTKINSPEDFAKKSIEEAIEEQADALKSLNFSSIHKFKLSENYQQPKQYAFIVEKGNRTFFVLYSERTLTLKLLANFKVKSAYSVVYESNSNSNTTSETYIVIDIITESGKNIDGIKIKNKAKINNDSFEEALMTYSNVLQMHFSKAQFKTFMQSIIIPKLKKTLLKYSYCGFIDTQKYLAENCLIENGNIYWDKNGIVQNEKDGYSIMINKEFEYPQAIISNSKRETKDIARDFLKNNFECWGENRAMVLLALGHLMMAPFYRKFATQKMGAPTLILCGISGAGKSTVIANGAAIFGFDERFLNAGDSTPLGMEGAAQAFYGINVCIDDLWDNILESKRFGSTIKKHFKSSPRIKRKNYGTSADITHTYSQMSYSTNGTFPEIPELVNRANIINFATTTLDFNNFKYLDENIDNRRELSKIMIELTKFNEKNVFEKHQILKEKLDAVIGKTTISRISHNIAYMWTGLQILEEIADFKIENLESEVYKYALAIKEKYESIPTPVDMLLKGLLAMKNNNVIVKGYQYNIKELSGTDDDGIYLIFHKETLLTAYNKFYAYDSNKRIPIGKFNTYINVDKRVKRTSITSYYNGNRKNSIMLNITDWDDVEEFADIYLTNNCNQT